MATIDTDASIDQPVTELRRLRSQVQFGNSLLAFLCLIEIVSVSPDGAKAWIPIALGCFAVLAVLSDNRRGK